MMLSSVLSLSLCPLSQCAPFSIKPKWLMIYIPRNYPTILRHMTLLIFYLHFGIVYSSFIENSSVNTWMCPKEGSPWSWIYTIHPGGGSFLRTCFGEEYPVIPQMSLHPLERICLNLQCNLISFDNVSDIFKFWSACWNLRDALSSECHGLMTEVKHMSIEVSVCNSVRR